MSPEKSRAQLCPPGCGSSHHPTLPRGYFSARIHDGGSSRSGVSVLWGSCEQPTAQGCPPAAPRVPRGGSLPSLPCQAAALGGIGEVPAQGPWGPEEWEAPSWAVGAEPTPAAAQGWVHPRPTQSTPRGASTHHRATQGPSAGSAGDGCLAEPRNSPASV